MKTTRNPSDQYDDALELKLSEADRLDELENYEASEIIYSEVIQACASLPFAYAKRGYAKEKQRKFRGAVEDYSAAIQRKPNSPVTTWRRARCYEHLDMLEEAKADYLQYMKLKGPDADAFFALSLINSYEGNAGAAIELCKQAAALAPDNEEIQNRLEVLKMENPQ